MQWQGSEERKGKMEWVQNWGPLIPWLVSWNMNFTYIIPSQVLEEKRASLATLHTSLPRPLPKEKPAHRGARSVRSLKRRKAGGSGEEYEALRTRSRSMEHILQPPGDQRLSGMDNPNYWVQPYSRSRSLPRHLERGERWEGEAWEGVGINRRASREDVGERRGWREEQGWSRGEEQGIQHRSWREELEERSARAEMERSWKMRRRTAETTRTPQAGRKSSDSSTPDTVQSSLHSLASAKSVTIAPTVEIIPRASLANSRNRREGEVSVNNVRIGSSQGREGFSVGRGEVGASQTLGREGLSLARENQGREGVTLGRGVRLGRPEETR